jgi:predicted TIM-barrel fold metal-dependent hydrolase
MAQHTNAAQKPAEREDILQPDLPIIDAHHHLWERAGSRYLLHDYLEEARTGHNIRASVFIECGSFYRKSGPELMAPVGQVEFANGMAAMAASGVYGDMLVCAGIVGTADLRVGSEVARVLDAQMAAAGDRFRGIRFITKWDADEALNTGRYKPPRGLMQDNAFRAGFAMLGPRKLSFDAMVYHPQHLELAELARAFPDTTIVVNHVGGPLAYTRTYLAHKEQALAHWRSSLVELAKCPNVYMKLGGLGMSYLGLGLEKLDVRPSSEQLAEAWRPFFESCIESFSPARCMFESNFPPDRESADFSLLWNAFKRVAARYSVEEQRALFHDTAARAYRLRFA